MKRKYVLTFVLMIIVLYGYTQHVNLNDGLVQYFPFDNHANDLSVNSFHGIIKGGLIPAAGFQGIENTAYDFANGSIHIPDTLTLFIPLTISEWINGNPMAAEREWITTYRSGKGSIDMGFFYNDGSELYTPRCSLNVSGEMDERLDSYKIKVSSGKWHHLLYEVRSDSMLLFIDGDLKDKKIMWFNDPESIQLAKADFGEFNGKIDEFRIYNRTLNALEKKALSDPTRSIVTGNDNLESINRYSIYPVPGKEFLNVEMYLARESNLTLSIFNVMGIKVLEFNYPSQTGKINISRETGDLDNGIYFLQAKTSNKIMKNKILIE